ncbi:ATG8-interacting protein 1-like [Mangifera indica]|uniref:ATG8-interacting protein 1-like n=1 Tax=Mangifera indica TaxID=29780 RepID=UPI001CFA476B|nr:ATG8-interacting protein 1-like [Mangifera indica]XP_044501828.1 ATG8-interacting protein 1-like [Mangifera indica]
MADSEEGPGNASRGNEWEVVSLTASAYAAAPGPANVEPKNDDEGDANGETEAEITRALFMSGHFVFPPSEHENLPLDPGPAKSEICNETVGKDVINEVGADEGARSSGKDDDENWTFKRLSVHNEFPGIQFLDEKGNRLSIPGTEFEEGTPLPGLNLSDKEGSICSAATFGSFHSEAVFGGSTMYDENIETEQTEHSEQGIDLPADASKALKHVKDDKCAASDLPCEAWWKRRASSLYAHAKEANAVWSIFIAAAVMGLVLIGQRWQQERWQALQLKWQLSISEERANRMLRPIARLKDAIVGGHRRGSFIRSSSSYDN